MLTYTVPNWYRLNELFGNTTVESVTWTDIPETISEPELFYNENKWEKMTVWRRNIILQQF
ncbi:hypothetical protein [Psychrobacillus sp. NPDC093180]|uniref:hypothetical protein n=1 Tax=Psychrobacillus sp. NPDC093180 TaxID=3364489 RepID=UPI0037F6037D